MSDEETYNRAPVRFIEIEQPRCALRFGESPCTATGTPLCYNTFWTCKDRENYTPTNVIRWRFYDGQNGNPFLYEVLGELVTNGAFDTDLSGWTTIGTTDWAWDGGVARLNSPDGNFGESILQQAFGGRDATKAYSFSIPEYLGGAGTELRVRIQDSVGSNPESTLLNITSAGNYSGTISAGYDTIVFGIYNGEPLEVTLDNVSIIGGEGGIATNAFPALRSASTQSTRLNIGGQSDNESAFGTRSKLTISFDEFEFDDHVGDPYIDDPDRNMTVAGFWAKFIARNPYFPDFYVRDYQGYEGQALSAMVKREYVLDNVEQDGPMRARVTTRDPLDLLNKAQFPRASDIQLVNALNETSTTVEVLCVETELTKAFGNTGSTRYLRFGNEIMRYTGYTGSEPDFTLTGVVRGVLGTTAETHDIADSAQRVGRYEDIRLYKVAEDLLDNHTTLPDRFLDFTQWDDEGETWLPTLKTTTTIADSEDVTELLAELSRDGGFFIWWDERTQTIPLRAVRPPIDNPLQWSDDLTVINDSFSERVETEDFVTRVTLYYNRRDPTEPLDDEPNYRVQSIRSDAELESVEANGGEINERKIFSRWINTASNALLLSARIMLQYKFPPRYLSIGLDAKDRTADIADVVDLNTRHKIDTEGARELARYQIIAIEENDPGHSVRVELQSFQFVGKFAVIMANDAPDYATATKTERETGCWFADNDGLMPNGDEPYLFQ